MRLQLPSPRFGCLQGSSWASHRNCGDVRFARLAKRRSWVGQSYDYVIVRYEPIDRRSLAGPQDGGLKWVLAHKLLASLGTALPGLAR